MHIFEPVGWQSRSIRSVEGLVLETSALDAFYIIHSVHHHFPTAAAPQRTLLKLTLFLSPIFCS